MYQFDGVNRLISPAPGTTQFQVRDTYSRFKDWYITDNNAKYPPAFYQFGNDPTTSGQSAPSYFFLINDWRMLIANMDVLVIGNLYTTEGDSPFIKINSAIEHKTSDAAAVDTGGGSDSAELVEIRSLLSAINSRMIKSQC